LHFFDDAGRFHLRPFVYHLQKSMDPVTLRELYDEDTTQRLAIRFFVRGDRYRLWGLFESEVHFFGIEEGRLFLIGADGLGQDMLSRLIYGGRVSLSVGLVGVAISFVLGIAIGGVSGYFGGPADLLIQRLIEFLRSIPTLPLWMGLSAALPPYWSMIQVYFGIVVILSLTGWTGLARVVRGKFMAVREEEFVMAAQLHGASKRRIIFKHLLPSFHSHVIASLTLAIPGMILGETALSFIGLGLQAPAISWGVLLREAQAIRVLANSPWILIPALFVIVAILAFNFVGDGLRDAADPYTAV
jgi:peptide/nickel transport system permease protein